MEVDSMTGAAETVEEIFKEAALYKQDKQWDYVVCLTDLPIFHYRDIVAADINEDKGIILLSIPAFGWGSLLKNRSEEHTSELQSRGHLVCRLLLEKNKKTHST